MYKGIGGVMVSITTFQVVEGFNPDRCYKFYCVSTGKHLHTRCHCLFQ